MTADLRLVIFDVDGTLVDSQGDILAAMAEAFAVVDQPLPDRATLLGVVGLSLEVIFPRLCPHLGEAEHLRMEAAYREAYVALRTRTGAADSSPLYPGALAALTALQARDEVLLGVATGKSKRGLDKLIAGHNLGGLFVTQQVADFQPSKPHPSMLEQALAETGVSAERAVMVGDTRFDMEMARAAGIPGIGVSWGYHPRGALDAAHCVIDTYEALLPALDSLWEIPA